MPYDELCDCDDCRRDREEYDREEYDNFCDNCGDGIDTDWGNYHYCDDCETYRCDDCGPCGDTYTRRVLPYDWRPDMWLPKGNPPPTVSMGVELEVGGYMSRIADTVELFDDNREHLYMKEDGSIDGVEIVTHPMTLQWALDYPFPKLLDALRHDANAHVNDGYGLHVHVARDSFLIRGRRPGRRNRSTRHQLAWLLFFSRNAPQLQVLARRQGSRWAQFQVPERGELVLKAKQQWERGGRYIAVNCLPRNTYELRFFQSTLSTGEFYAALELADASVEYTRFKWASTVLNNNGLTWPHFVEWAQEQNRYHHLMTEIARLGLDNDNR